MKKGKGGKLLDIAWIENVYETLKKARRVLSWEEFAKQIGYNRTYLSRVLNGHEKLTDDLLQRIEDKFIDATGAVTLADFEGEVKVPVTIDYLAEKIIKIEAGMEVERSLLIDLLAIVSKKTTTEISTAVKEALDYQISKRMSEL